MPPPTDEQFEPYKDPPPEERCYTDGVDPDKPRRTVPRPTPSADLDAGGSSGVLADISNIDKVSTGECSLRPPCPTPTPSLLDVFWIFGSTVLKANVAVSAVAAHTVIL